MKDSFKLYSSHLLHGLEAIILFLITFYSPVAIAFIMIGAFQILDTILGFFAAVKRGKAHSRPLRLGFTSKFIVYFSMIAVLFIVDYGIMNDLLQHVFGAPSFISTKILALLLCGIEFKSINEKFEMITGFTLLGLFRKFTRVGSEVVSSINDIKEGNYNKHKDDDTNSKPESES